VLLRAGRLFATDIHVIELRIVRLLEARDATPAVCRRRLQTDRPANAAIR
jgi:hypothetical protein